MAFKPVHAVGIGAGLVGSFLIFREAQKWWAKRKLDKLRQAAVAGEIAPKVFLDAVLANGIEMNANTPRITIEDAKRMRCVDVFPPDVLAQIPQGQAALQQLRLDGTCV